MKLVDPFDNFPTLAEQWAEDDAAEAADLLAEEATEDLHNLIEKMSSDTRQPILLYLEAKKRVMGFLDEMDSIYLQRLRFFECKKLKLNGETYRQRMDRLFTEILARDAEKKEQSDGV